MLSWETTLLWADALHEPTKRLWAAVRIPASGEKPESLHSKFLVYIQESGYVVSPCVPFESLEEAKKYVEKEYIIWILNNL